MPLPTTVDITMQRAADVTIYFVPCEPRSISGWAITFTVADSSGGTVRITKTVGSGITVSSAAEGLFQVAIASADTSALTPGRFEWEAKRTDSGSITYLARGNFILTKQVS